MLNEHHVKCTLAGCKQGDKWFNYSQILDHVKSCFNKEAKCPLNCGSTIKSRDETQYHFDICPKVFI
jgi:hypothetical protein